MWVVLASCDHHEVVSLNNYVNLKHMSCARNRLCTGRRSLLLIVLIIVMSLMIMWSRVYYIPVNHVIY